jgi:hypothetical protein
MDALKSSLSRQGQKSTPVTLGRIALSEKGFVVDVPTEYVSALLNSRRLKSRNIQAIHIKELPRIVDRDKSFVIKQFVSDKQFLSRMLMKRTRRRTKT